MEVPLEIFKNCREMSEICSPKKHSSKMPTTPLPTVNSPVLTSGGHQCGPQVNKFEQVSSDGHQTSLAWRQGWGSHVWCPRWGPYTVSTKALWVMVTWVPPCGQIYWETDTSENIAFPQLRLRAVKINILRSLMLRAEWKQFIIHVKWLKERNLKA